MTRKKIKIRRANKIDYLCRKYVSSQSRSPGLASTTEATQASDSFANVLLSHDANAPSVFLQYGLPRTRACVAGSFTRTRPRQPRLHTREAFCRLIAGLPKAPPGPLATARRPLVRACASSRASDRSIHRSCLFSRPTESLSRSSGVSLLGPSTDLRCYINDSTPPSEVAGNHTLVREVVNNAASLPPAHRILSMPPNSLS